MKKNTMIYLLILIIAISMPACKKPEPVKIWFRNLICCDRIYDKAWVTARDAVDSDPNEYRNYFSDCANGITTTPGVVWVCDFEKPIGADRVTWQVINKETGEAYTTNGKSVDPKTKNWQMYTNLPYKGKFIINLQAGEEIIATGNIEYR